MMALILTYLVCGVLVIAGLAWRFKAHASTYGSSRWLPVWAASAEGMFKRRGLLLGDWTGLLPVYAGQDGHVLTIAPTGRGKGTCAIIPNLLRQRFIFLVDPGGENTAVAIKGWRAKGFDVQVLNPWGMHQAAPWHLPAHGFNPLAILDPKSANFASDAALIAEMLIARGINDGGSTGYFKDEAKSGIRAMLMHMVTTLPHARCNLVTLRAWIMSGGAEWAALMNAMVRNKAAAGAVAREATQLLRRQEQAPEEFSAIVSTMKQDTNFLDDPVMADALAAHDADFAALKGLRDGKAVAGAVVAVVIPLEYLRTHAAYARLAIAVALWEMQRAPHGDERVLFVLDEFPALGRMDRIASGLAELRKYKVWLWPIIQDLSQLKTLYQTSWATFLSNASVKQWFGTSDLDTAKYVSEICGEQTLKGSSGNLLDATGRRLKTPAEVFNLGAREQIVTAGNLHPLKIGLTPYWERPEFIGLFHPNPYKAGTPPLPARTALRALWGTFVRIAALILEPAPVLLYAAALALVLWLRPAVLVDEHDAYRRYALTCVYRGITGRTERQLYPVYGSDKHCPPVLLFGEKWQ